ncbi:fatty acid desaturase family protein [Chamaesiphon polymorphus]|uniref:Fatty acid desaturase n=1 Tax=Chamaesiphon polymorphus CCALA 037 TaxID=2107692 RepID=A0A2T1GDW5_9CYAN|nr:fatty acid desaturase family protein [Chamaesiphon polymorphus]PSB55710.1 fatty acid desaturase [Chamaesiphon polymorphus CCALA 037]
MDLFVSESAPIDSSLDCPTLSADTLKQLNTRSTAQGTLRLALHLLILLSSGYLWSTNIGEHWPIALPALVIYGFSLAAMFAPVHECSHRTVFANNTLNDAVGWIAGVLSFYNITFFRRYHKWHHRYTQDPDKDPEMSDPKLQTWGDYLLAMSGLPWWWGKLTTHFRVAMGQLDSYPFIPETAREEVIRSTRWQLGVYAIAIGISIIFGQPWFITYWLLPLFIGQPILRFILLAEHTGCSGDRNPYTNTRSTLTLLPVRLLMWNMPFHAEHHLYPSIPFYQLPIAHQQLKAHFSHVEPGYIHVNRAIVAGLNSAV